MSVTVLVSVLNMKGTIKKCIDSIIESESNKEILVVDGYSTDGTYEILKNYGNKIQLIQERPPVPNQWNMALELIETEFVAFTDADCIVDKDWLKNLLLGFEKNSVIATAGYCGTPNNVSKLQKIIGLELESRFKSFPEFITRAPTMNLCVRSTYAKRIKFKNELITASEVDFGWRLSKLGKIRYISTAKIWHFHRNSWLGFIKQQQNYAHYMFLIYFRYKHKFKGDHISTPDMIYQVPLLESAIIFLFLGMINHIFLFGSIVSLSLLCIQYLKTYMTFKSELLLFMLVSFVRTFSWIFGSMLGLFELFKNNNPWIHRVCSNV